MLKSDLQVISRQLMSMWVFDRLAAMLTPLELCLQRYRSFVASMVGHGLGSFTSRIHKMEYLMNVHPGVL